MKRREFDQYCGLARALELVGERWALLIVRELLARPCRYTDLLQDLPGIPTNVLATRLKELEAAKIVERQVAPAPQRGILYALTPEGQRLEPIVISLARWGNQWLGERGGQMVPASTVALSLRAMFHPEAADQVSTVWEIHAAESSLHVIVRDGAVTTGVGAAPEPPDLVMTMTGGQDEVATSREILAALQQGKAKLDGDPALLKTFLRLFALPPTAG